MNKYEKKVNLGLVNAVKDFVTSAMKAPFDITAGAGRFIVDGKSIMGLFSLDLSKEITISFECEDDTAVEAFLSDISKYIC